MFKFFLSVSIIFVIVGIIFGITRVFILEPVLYQPVSKMEEVISDVESTTQNLLEKIEEKIAAPPPLQALPQPTKLPTNLTNQGTFVWTNIQRATNGIMPLNENQELVLVAKAKLQDMFEHQYFAHVSPLGTGVDYFVSKTEYLYILVGENLALGDFGTDEKLVQAWMDSPGHRANILNPKFTEIGVATRKGNFEGKPTWLAVQVFGLPRESCPEVSETLEAQIENRQHQIEQLFLTLDQLKNEIETMTSRRNQAYNQKIQEYNMFVTQYNTLVEETKVLINQYNLQLHEFNECINKYTSL